MFQTIEANSADQLWIKAASWFRSDGLAVAQDSRAGQTSEVMRVGLTLEEPRQRWIASRVPAMNPAFALAEVIWILAGRNDSAFLNYFNPKLPRFAGQGETYHGAYGYRMRRHFEVDQLERVWKILSSNPDSRQVVLQIWDCSGDLPIEDGSPRAADIPCNVVGLLKLRSNRLEWTQIMRSNDLYLGLPHNIIQFSTLQEVMSGWLNAELGHYHHFTDSLHLYESDGKMSDRISPCTVPPNTDSVALPKALSDESIASLSKFCDGLISEGVSAVDAIRGFERLQVHPSFRNWAAILCAEALRRRGSIQDIGIVLSQCTNDCLRFMFERWLCRVSESHSQ